MWQCEGEEVIVDQHTSRRSVKVTGSAQEREGSPVEYTCGLSTTLREQMGYTEGKDG